MERNLRRVEAVEKEEMEKGKVGECFKWRRGRGQI